MNQYSILKTMLDYLISSIGLIIFAPFFLIYAFYLIIFKKTSPIIVQSRGIGLLGEKVKIFKLRTMKKEPEVFFEKGKTLRRKASPDQFLPMGRFFRKTGIDEIPQLLNVLAGKMSIIGPRPLMVEDLERMEEFSSEFSKLRNGLTSKPGISGLWQLERSGELSFNELLSLDLKYETKKNTKMEIHLLFKTIIKMLKRDHSDSIDENRSKILNAKIAEGIHGCSLNY